MNIFLFVLSLILSSGVAHSDDAPVSMSMPCGLTQAGNCRIAFLECSRVVGTLKSDLQRLLDTKIRYIYGNAIHVDVFRTTDPNHPIGTPLVFPICNLGDNELDRVNTSLPNHSTPVPECGDYQRYHPGRIDRTRPTGARETAYVQGALVQAYKCFTQQVFNEIDTNKAVLVKYLTSASRDLDAAWKRLETSIIAGGTSAICGLPANCFGNMDFCQQPEEDSQANACHRIAVCKVYASELDLQSAFEHVAFMEIENRTLHSWLKFNDDYQGLVYRNVETPCFNEVRRSSRPSNGSILGYVSIDQQRLSDNMNGCYPAKYRAYMKRIIDEKYPSDGNCQ